MVVGRGWGYPFDWPITEGGKVFAKLFANTIIIFPFLFPAFSAAREQSEVHLAACPCGADHVARTTFGHLFPGACRIRDCFWRYSNQNFIGREDLIDVFGVDLIESLLIVWFCGFPAASVKGLTAEVDGTWSYLMFSAPNLFCRCMIEHFCFQSINKPFHCYIQVWSGISYNL